MAFDAYIDGRFLVYYSEDVTASEWLLAPRISVLSFRQQKQGMGSASLRLDQKINFDEEEDPANLNSRIPAANNWMVIIDKYRMPAFFNPAANDFKTDVRVLTDDENKPICWFGRVGVSPIEIHEGDQDRDGFIEAHEPGFYLLGNPIHRDFVHPGYNPEIDNTQYGNCRPTEGYRYLAELTTLWDEMGEPNDEAYAWTPIRILHDLAYRCLSVRIAIDEPSLDAIENQSQFLFEPMSVPSYEGQTFITAAQELLNPLDFYFELSKFSGVAMNIVLKAPAQISAPPALITGATGATGATGPEPLPSKEIDLTTLPTRNFFITDSEEIYNRIRLVGQRIQIAASVTTFGPRRVDEENVNMCPVVVHNWFNKDDFVNAQDWTPSTWAIDDYLADQGLEPGSDEADELIEEINYVNKTYRDTLITYQDFVWKYAPLEDQSPALYCPEYPGLILDGTIPYPIAEHTHNTVYTDFPYQFLFPKFKLQNDDFTLYATPEIIEGEHATPNVLSFEAMDYIPLKDNNDEWLEPKMYIRGISTIDTDVSDPEDYRKPFWFEADMPATNKQTMSWVIDGKGIKVDAPYPELLACSDESIFYDRYGAGGGSITSKSYWGTASDIGEWDESNENQGYSERHPDAFRANSQSHWPDRGHWSRIVWSAGFLSDQRYEVIYEKQSESESGPAPIIDREKVIVDEDLIMRVRLKGFVSGLLVGFLDGERSVAELATDTEASTTVVQSPAFEANKTLWALWEWYSKKRLSITAEFNLFHDPETAPAEVHKLPIELGDLISKVKDNNPDPAISFTEFEVNTSVSSIEYFIEDDQPRIVVTTELPSAPPMSRFRRMVL